MGMIAERILHGLVEIGARFARILHQAQVVDQLEVRNAGRRADGVRRIGPAMADGAVLVGPLFQHLPHLVGNDRA